MIDHRNGWISASHQGDDGTSTVRLRRPDAGLDFRRLPERMTLLWRGADTAAGQAAMQEFEQRVQAQLDNDGDTVLAMVFVEPDHAEFVFHSRSTPAFFALLEALQSGGDPYPIEVEHESDPTGELYRSYASEMGSR